MGKDIVPSRRSIMPFLRKRVVRLKAVKLTSASAASIIRSRVGATVNAGLQLHVYQVTTPGGVLVVTIIVDNSGSARKHHRAMVAGINKAATLIKAETTADIGATLTMKAMSIELPWMVGLPIDLVELPIELPYAEEGKTPRFRGVLETLGVATGMVREISSRGIPALAVTLIVTDDEQDNASWPTTAEDVAMVIGDMRRHGHIFRGLGVGNPIKYRATFRSMGLLDSEVDDADGDLQMANGFQRFATVANKTRLALTVGG